MSLANDQQVEREQEHRAREREDGHYCGHHQPIDLSLHSIHLGFQFLHLVALDAIGIRFSALWLSAMSLDVWHI